MSELIFQKVFNIVAAEGVKLVYDFGGILDHISKPACGHNAKTLYKALMMFKHYYEQNEAFDHYTHRIGPGIVGFVIHAFMEFMGELVYQEIDHQVTSPKKGTPLCVYVSKLHEIVSSVVTEEADKSTGCLCKVEEVKSKEKDVVPPKSKSRARTKQMERKQLNDVEELDDVDIASVSGSEDENNFTTLLGPTGLEYHPPSHKKQPSRFSHKEQSVDISSKIDLLQMVMEQQQSKINHFIRENESAINKIKKLQVKKISDTKQTKMSSFVTTQQLTGLDSDSDVQEVRIKRPDSTQPKIVQGSDSGSEDIPSAQARQKKKKQHAHIESTSTIEQQEEKCEVDTEDDPEAAVVMEL